MLRRPEGRATVAQIAEAKAWNSNTVRGFLAGLKTKVHAGQAAERVRQVGPNKTGANTNELLRQYFPKGTDLSAHSAYDLAAVAATLNSRPRRTLG